MKTVVVKKIEPIEGGFLVETTTRYKLPFFQKVLNIFRRISGRLEHAEPIVVERERFMRTIPLLPAPKD